MRLASDAESSSQLVHMLYFPFVSMRVCGRHPDRQPWQLPVRWRRIFLLAGLAVVWTWGTCLRAESPSHGERFEEIWSVVRDGFFDPHFQGVDWEQARQHYAPAAAQARSEEEFATVVNTMLAELHTSHTHLYTAQEPEYFQLCATFWPFLGPKLKSFLPGGKPDYPGIGIITRMTGGKVFIRDIFDGSPAAEAGLRTGDELLAVDGAPFAPLASFVGKTGKAVQVQVRRTVDAPPINLAVTPRMLDPTTQFLDALKTSVEVTEHGGVKVGYVHVWSYAGEQYQMALEDELNGRLHAADALVLEHLEGWGINKQEYLWPFFAPAMTQSFVGRDGVPSTEHTAWTKPVCLLVNEGTRSGKEPLTYLFKKSGRGPVVGTRTAGAVMAGRPFVLGDGSLLMVAVMGGTTDGVNLEGHGVQPTVEVPFEAEYTVGADPQKARAVDIMAQAGRR